MKNLLFAAAALAFSVLAAPAAPAADGAGINAAPGLGGYDVPFFPDGTYRPEVQSPDDFLGFVLGSRPATYEQIVAYFTYLAQGRSNVTLYDYGLSCEGRRLVYLVVTSEENAARLPEIRRGLQKLSDPRKVSGESEAAEIIKNSPAVAWLAYGIHGDELSSCDAALQLAYQLVAGEDDDTRLVRDELIVCIDPLQNPDGRSRWLGQMAQWNGIVPSSDINSLHHRGTWPYGRTNHYLFDLNRDWFAMVQPESRARTAAVLEWMPHYVLDCHEMGPTDTYLLSPPREPFNPYMVEYIYKWWRTVAEDHAEAFDRYGWSYYTREWNEEFYPGYGSSWGIYLGAVGMLFEQAGVDGSLVKRREGTVMTYRETVHHQFVGSFSNLRTIACGREELLSDFYGVKRRNVRPDRGRMGAYVFVPGKNETRLEHFAQTLAHQNVEIEVATEPFKIGRAVSSTGAEVNGKTCPEGSLIINTAQPERQLIDVLLQFDIRVPDSFLKTEKKEILKRGRTKIYEATAWSLPLAYDLDAYFTGSPPRVKTVPYAPRPAAGGLSGEKTSIGFVFDCTDDRSFHLLIDLLNAGYKVRSARRAFENRNVLYPRGSFQIRFNDNPDLDVEALGRMAREAGVEVRGIETSLGNKWADLGGDEFALLERPRIALVGGPNVSTSDFGALWHLLDGRFGTPASLLDLTTLDRADLDKYNVLVLSDSWGGAENYKNILGKNAIGRLSKWVESGGTLVGVGTAAAFMADSTVGLSRVRQKRQSLKNLSVYDAALAAARNADDPDVDSLFVWEGTSKSTPAPEETKKAEGSPEYTVLAQRDETARRLFPRGAILAVDLDEEHWLTSGCHGKVPVLFDTGYAYLAGGGVEVAGRLARAENLRLSGLLWPEARERWAETVYLSREAKGKGQVILFAATANFRGYFYGAERLLLNALFLGPGFGTTRSIEW